MKHLSFIIVLLITSCKQRHEIRIDLSGHNLKSIPDSVFDKDDLVYLNLGSSGITFYPPLSALVDSGANELTELPASIGKLTELKTLILNSNRLKTLPDAITKLTKLEVLDLSLNNDLDIMNEIGKINQLPKLKVLRIVLVKLNEDKVQQIKKSLRPGIKIITGITNYLNAE